MWFSGKTTMIEATQVSTQSCAVREKTILTNFCYKLFIGLKYLPISQNNDNETVTTCLLYMHYIIQFSKQPPQDRTCSCYHPLSVRTPSL